MTTTYTKIPKATGTSYTKISGGYIAFDDPSVAFDDSNTNFDGNRITYTKITKASGTAYTKIAKAT